MAIKKTSKSMKIKSEYKSSVSKNVMDYLHDDVSMSSRRHYCGGLRTLYFYKGLRELNLIITHNENINFSYLKMMVG